VCVRVYVHVCVRVSVYVRVCVCANSWAGGEGRCVCVLSSACIHKYIYLKGCVYVQSGVCLILETSYQQIRL